LSYHYIIIINSIYDSISQRVVHDADVFEIARVLQNPSNEFKLDQLSFTTLDEFRDFPTEALDEEVIKFIKITDNPKLKRHLEDNSQNYLKDMVLIFRTLNGNSNTPVFPLMGKYLDKLDRLVPKTDHLDPRVIEILSA